MLALRQNRAFSVLWYGATPSLVSCSWPCIRNTSSSTASVTDPIVKGDDDSTASPSPKPATRRRFPLRRPNISLANPREWNRPIRKGALPAYDEALKLIENDSRSLHLEMADLTKAVRDAEKKGNMDEEALRAMKEKLDILEIQSQINTPAVRWKFANGMGDMSKLVYLRLAEQRWRNMGALDLLMERIHQMNVVPDLLPSIHPSFDLRITFPEPPPKSVYLRTRVKRKYQQVEPGQFLLPEQTRKPPRLYTTVFHPDTRYYTMLLVDPDVPDVENRSFTTYLHWMQPNIPLSALSASPIPSHPHTRYISPHPQRGSPYHRYSLFVLPHPVPDSKLTIPAVPDSERLGFNMREFCERYGLDASKGGAAHMWREVWDETVSGIYRDTLKSSEPKFGLPPRQDPYAEVKSINRYTS